MKQRATVAAILGGIALVFVLAILVIGPGRHHPSPPSLQDHPNPAIPGELLWLDGDGCIIRAAASGATRERVSCPNVPNPIQEVMWLDGGAIGYLRYDQNGPMLVSLDPATKAETELGPDDSRIRTPFRGPAALSANGERAEVRDGGEVWLGRAGELIQIHTFDVGNSARPGVAAWSPDGQWLALQYFGGRSQTSEIWLLSRDGRTAGTLTKDAGPAGAISWRIEGVGISPSQPAKR